MLKDYAGKTVEWFAGHPRIVLAHDPRIKPLTVTQRSPFILDLEIIQVPGQGDVYDGLKRIASFLQSDKSGCTRLWVLPPYRGRGIAPELIYQVMIRTPGLPARSTARTAISQAIYLKVWDRIQKELQNVAA